MARHQCPGRDCTAQVPSEMLACRAHWFQLPEPLRSAIWRAYRGPGPGSPEHTDAIAAALDWYDA